MKPVWLIILVALLFRTAAGHGSGMPAPGYAIVDLAGKPPKYAPASPEAADSPTPRIENQAGQWVTVGENPAFHLQFVDVLDSTGTGFDDPELGAARRAVALHAFDRVSRILAGEPGSAAIRIDSRSPYFNGETLAVGVPYFRCIDGFQKPIIFDALRNDIHVHDFEGDLAVNFSLPLNAGMEPPEPGQYDLFTVIFHEITHILGFVGFTVQADGLPSDCGGARMMPALGKFATTSDGAQLWVEQDGKIDFIGAPEQLPASGQPVLVDFPESAQPPLRLATGPLIVSGHWLPDDFDKRTGVLMLQEPIPSGVTRRNLTPETKLVLKNVLDYVVNEEPRGLTGSWFDPATNGQGFSLHFVTADQFVVYFFGFTDARERLWMIGVHQGGLALGADLSVPLFEAVGGRFNGFDPGEVSEAVWGWLDIRFHDCLNAQATLTGADGTQEMHLVHLAGVDALNCY